MKKIIKENYKKIIFFIILFICLTIHLPYYIDAPGGISNIGDKIELDGYESEGSFNLVYVKEYKATIPTLLYSLINKNWNIYKVDDVMLDTEDDDSYLIRDKILMNESISNAIYVAYTSADKEIKLKNNKATVLYIDKLADTSLKVGDEIISIDGKTIQKRDDLLDIIKYKSENDKINIKVKNNNKEYDRYAYVKLEDNEKKIGIVIVDMKEYETNPEIKIKVDKNESGSSGGLALSLSIYNSLVKEDITKGKKIIVTGTIDEDGNVGSIGGIKYKLMSAENSKAPIFIVPNGENYDEAIKLKNENNYKIKIIGVSTFNETLDLLKNI